MSANDGKRQTRWAARAWHWATTVDLRDTQEAYESDTWAVCNRVMWWVHVLVGAVAPTASVLQLRAVMVSSEGQTFLAIALPVFLVVAVLISPLQIFMMLGFQAVNPFSADVWHPPTLRSSLFDLRNPLPFTAFAVRSMWACAWGWMVGCLASFLWFEALTSLALMGCGLAVFGVAYGSSLGLRWSMRSFKHKLPPAEAVHPPVAARERGVGG